jgi:hypothetical protein
MKPTLEPVSIAVGGIAVGTALTLRTAYRW